MKNFIFISLLTLSALVGYSQQSGQSENLIITNARVLPRPTTVGGTVNASFLFFAENGATLNTAGGEVIRFIVCFNRITSASIANANVVTQYDEGGDNNFVTWTYNAFSDCWIGIINKSLVPGTGFIATFNNLIAGRSATPADANNSVGIGFSVNLTPHSGDPSSGDDDDFTDNYTYTVDNSADIQVSKNGPSAVTSGGTLSYTLAITNNGPGAADNTKVSDPSVSNFTATTVTCGSATEGAVCPSSISLSELQNGTLTIPSLPANGSVILTVTGTAGSSGTIENVATVTPPSGVTDPTPENNTSTVTTTIEIPSDPKIALVKTGAVSSDANSITYTFIVTNTGNVTLSNVTVTDDKITGPVTVSPSTLAPGATATGTATYTITEADRTAGKVVNQALVTGTPPSGTPVTDESGTTIDNDTPTETPVNKCPQGVKCLTVKVTKNK